MVKALSACSGFVCVSLCCFSIFCHDFFHWIFFVTGFRPNCSNPHDTVQRLFGSRAATLIVLGGRCIHTLFLDQTQITHPPDPHWLSQQSHEKLAGNRMLPPFTHLLEMVTWVCLFCFFLTDLTFRNDKDKPFQSLIGEFRQTRRRREQVIVDFNFEVALVQMAYSKCVSNKKLF